MLAYVKYALNCLVYCILYLFQGRLYDLQKNRGRNKKWNVWDTNTMFGRDRISSALKQDMVLTASSVW